MAAVRLALASGRRSLLRHTVSYNLKIQGKDNGALRADRKKTDGTGRARAPVGLREPAAHSRRHTVDTRMSETVCYAPSFLGPCGDSGAAEITPVAPVLTL